MMHEINEQVNNIQVNNEQKKQSNKSPEETFNHLIFQKKKNFMFKTLHKIEEQEQEQEKMILLMRKLQEASSLVQLTTMMN